MHLRKTCLSQQHDSLDIEHYSSIKRLFLALIADTHVALYVLDVLLVCVAVDCIVLIKFWMNVLTYYMHRSRYCVNETWHKLYKTLISLPADEYSPIITCRLVIFLDYLSGTQNQLFFYLYITSIHSNQDRYIYGLKQQLGDMWLATS